MSPTTLRLLAGYFVAHGIGSSVAFASSLFTGSFVADIGILGLFIGTGLAGRARRWRPWGIAWCAAITCAAGFAVVARLAKFEAGLNLGILGVPMSEVPLPYVLGLATTECILALFVLWALLSGEVRRGLRYATQSGCVVASDLVDAGTRQESPQIVAERHPAERTKPRPLPPQGEVVPFTYGDLATVVSTCLKRDIQQKGTWGWLRERGLLNVYACKPHPSQGGEFNRAFLRLPAAERDSWAALILAHPPPDQVDYVRRNYRTGKADADMIFWDLVTLSNMPKAVAATPMSTGHFPSSEVMECFLAAKTDAGEAIRRFADLLGDPGPRH